MTAEVLLRIKAILTACLLVSAAAVLGAQQSSANLQDQYESLKISLLPDPAPSTYLNWGVTEGFRQINEPTFLKLAGFEKEAQVSANHQFLKWSLYGGGIVISAVGMVVMLYQLTVPEFSAASEDLRYLIIGGSMGFGGLIPMLISISIPLDTVPYGRAQQIVRDYNDALIEKLNKQNSAATK